MSGVLFELVEEPFYLAVVLHDQIDYIGWHRTVLSYGLVPRPVPALTPSCTAAAMLRCIPPKTMPWKGAIAAQ